MSIYVLKTMYRDSMWDYIHTRLNHYGDFDKGYTAGRYRTLDIMLESELNKEDYLQTKYMAKLEMSNIFKISFLRVCKIVD